MKYFSLVLTALLLVGCGKDSPKPPEAAILSFPLQNSECTTGISLNATTSQVEFRWQAAKHATTYTLRVTNVLTGIPINYTPTEGLTTTVALQKGVPYKWSVTTRNTSTEDIATSAEWFFYNAGSQTTFPPFPAAILAPASGASVVRDINNDITLSWEGADVDNDIQMYTVYMDSIAPPAIVIGSPSVSVTTIKAAVLADTVYYWRVVTTDREGNTSDSGTYSFRVVR